MSYEVIKYNKEEKPKWQVPDLSQYLFNYTNNVIANNRAAKEQSKMQATPLVAPSYDYTTSSDYLTRQQTMQNIAEGRAAFERQASNSSDLDQQMTSRLAYEQQVVQPAISEMDTRTAQHLQQEKDKAIGFKNQTIQGQYRAINDSAAQADAVQNYKNDIKAKNILSNAKERADLTSKISAVIDDFQTSQNQNEQYRIARENQRDYNHLLSGVQKEYNDRFKIAAQKASQADIGGKYIQFEEIVNWLLANDETLTDEERAALSTAPTDYESAISIIKAKQKLLTETAPNNQEPIIHPEQMRLYLQTIDHYLNTANERYTTRKTELDDKLYRLQSMQNPLVHSSSSRRGLGSSWGTQYQEDQPFLKKGGKVIDRWKQFLDYKAKRDKLNVSAVEDESKRLSSDLGKRLEALDRETLILLRSIFK